MSSDKDQFPVKGLYTKPAISCTYTYSQKREKEKVNGIKSKSMIYRQVKNSLKFYKFTFEKLQFTSSHSCSPIILWAPFQISHEML